MRVTIKELKRIIKEEYAKVLEEAIVSGDPQKKDTQDFLKNLVLAPEDRANLANLFTHLINTPLTRKNVVNVPPNTKASLNAYRDAVEEMQAWAEQLTMLIKAGSEEEPTESVETIVKRIEALQDAGVPLDDPRVQALMGDLATQSE